MSELVSAYPTSGGIYWWASKLGGAKAGYYTGLAQPDRPAGGRRLGGLRLRDLLRPLVQHDERVVGRGVQPPARLLDVPRRARAHRAASTSSAAHILAMLNNISVWWHVAGAAIIIALLVFLPDKHMSVSDVFTMRVNNSGGSGRRGDQRMGVLVLRAPARLPAHPVHDHRVRRLGSPVRGDPRRGRRCRQGHLALDLLLRGRRLGPPARLPLRGAGRGCRDGRRWRRGRHLQPGAVVGLGGHGAAHRQHRPVLLHHGLHDVDEPDAVRVLPRRCRARAPSTGRASPRARCRPTRC